jgi:hypothetical protein
MGSLRFIGIVAILFVAVFFGGKWLLEVRPLRASAWLPTYHRVDKQDEPRLKLEKTSATDNDPARDRLRTEVLDYAKALADDPCNGILKMHYIKAVIDYVRACISIAPCLGTHTCRWSDSPRMDLATRAFGSPLDLRVRDAMQKVHAKGVFGIGDFPQDTVTLVSQLAADGSVNPDADPRFRSMTVDRRSLATCVERR